MITILMSVFGLSSITLTWWLVIRGVRNENREIVSRIPNHSRPFTRNTPKG